MPDFVTTLRGLLEKAKSGDAGERFAADDASAEHADLNRAIVEFVAKMQSKASAL